MSAGESSSLQPVTPATQTLFDRVPSYGSFTEMDPPASSTSKHDTHRPRRWSHSAELRVRQVPKRPQSMRHNSYKRSISQKLYRAVAGESDDELDDTGASIGHRRTSMYFMAHPTSVGEAIATYTPSSRIVSAAVRVTKPLDESNEEDDGQLEESESASIPYGVRKMEVIARYVPKQLLFIAIYTITLFTSLSSTTTPAVEPYLLSTFGGHSYISSIAIVTSIAYAVCKPPMAKILDVFGRAEGMAISAILYGIGYLLVSSAGSIFTFGVARVIGSAGAQGINLAQQVIVADITSLASRGLVTSTIFLPWLITPWIGPPIAQGFKNLGETGYRSAYTLFGITVPLSCLLLLLALWRAYGTVLRLTNDAKPAIDALKADHGRVEADATLVWRPRSFQALAFQAHNELDLPGILYLMVGCTFFLLPLSLAPDAIKAWREPIYPTLAALGLAFLCLFFYHEAYIASFPLIPTRLTKKRTVLAGCFLGAFHFLSAFAYDSYFPSFLQVARYYSARDASYISESYVFTASIAALVCGYLIKVTRRYRFLMIIGIIIHMVGAYMMVRFRNLDNSTFDLVLSQITSGFGGGLTTLSVQLGIQAAVDHQDVAIVTAAFLTITQIGGAVGGAASGAIWKTCVPFKLQQYLPHLSKQELDEIFGSMSAAMAYLPGTLERDGINRAYLETQRYLNLVALFGLFPALICAFMMKNIKLTVDEEEEEEQRVVFMAETEEISTAPEPFSDDEDGFPASLISRSPGSNAASMIEHTPLKSSRTNDW